MPNTKKNIVQKNRKDVIKFKYLYLRAAAVPTACKISLSRYVHTYIHAVTLPKSSISKAMPERKYVREDCLSNVSSWFALVDVRMKIYRDRSTITVVYKSQTTKFSHLFKIYMYMFIHVL